MVGWLFMVISVPRYYGLLFNIENVSEFGFLTYDSKPMSTKYVSSSEVLEFRDNAWQTYFTNPAYLNLVEKKFGSEEKDNVVKMSKIKLKRKLLGD